VTELDKSMERPVYSPVCDMCRHLGSYDPMAERQNCAAFPDGIPDEIWLGRNKHKAAYPGDHGIRFEPHPDATPEVLRREGLMEATKRGRRRRAGPSRRSDVSGRFGDR